MTYKTVFVDAQNVKPNSKWGAVPTEINGDQLARDVDAAIAEMEHSGYLMINMVPIISSKIHMGSFSYTFTEGILVTFKKETSS